MAIEKCAYCGYRGKVGLEIVPYYIDRKTIKGTMKWDPVTRKQERQEDQKISIHRWLCGLQTGRDCSVKWLEKWREWKKKGTTTERPSETSRTEESGPIP